MERKNIDRRILIPCLVILLITGSIFLFTVKIRHPWFGSYTGNAHEWLTGSNLKFANNWLMDGPWNDKFGMWENLPSPEFPTLDSRGSYISYPPGAVLPIYLLSLLTHQNPGVSLVMAYNLLNHFLIALFLALSVFAFLRNLKLDYRIAAAFSVIPILLELLLPSPLYFHQNVFFSDQAVILPFVLVLFMEIVRENLEGRWRTFLDLCQSLIFFYGVLTDWFLIFVWFFFYLKRLLDGQIPAKKPSLFLMESLKFAAAPLIGIALFVVQVVWVFNADLGAAYDGFKYLFLYRAGVSEEGSSFAYYYRAISEHIQSGYGPWGIWLVWSGVLFFVIGAVYLLGAKKAKWDVPGELKKIVLLAFVIAGPCLAQIAFFKNHSVVHSFSVLKLSVLISILPFVLMPLFMGYLIKKYLAANVQKIILVLLLTAIVSAGFYVAKTHPLYQNFFSRNDRDPYEFGKSVKRSTGPDDIVFSPDLQIAANPPQQLSLSRKRVYPAGSAADVIDFIKDIQTDFRVVYVFQEKPQDIAAWRAEGLTADGTAQDGAFFYMYFKPRI